MLVGTALAASGTAFFALFLEAVIDGAVTLGLHRDHAEEMAAQTMAGAASLTISGNHPAVVRSQVTTPGGFTARGLAIFEADAVRRTIIQGLREIASTHRI